MRQGRQRPFEKLDGDMDPDPNMAVRSSIQAIELGLGIHEVRQRYECADGPDPRRR